MRRIFTKKRITQQLENLETRIEDGFKPSLLEKIVHYSSILGTITSFAFAIWGINLTMRYGESKDQINRLDNLVYQQKIQIDTLVGILQKLDKQNELVREQNNELKIQGTEIFNQTRVLGNQLSILENQQTESTKHSKLSRQANFNKLKKALTDIGSLAPWQGNVVFKSYDKGKQINVINELIKLLESELYNPFLIENDEAFSKWTNFYSGCRLKLHMIDLPAEDFKLSVVGDDRISKPVTDIKERATFQQKEFELFVDEYYSFYFFFLNEILKKEKSVLF